MAVRVVHLGALSTRAQLALIQRTSLLVGAHGAGLLWNLFLPEGATLVELLNLANANQYYANHCRWARRRYGKWQNTDAAREERAAALPLSPTALAEAEARAGAAEAELLAMLELEEAGVDGKSKGKSKGKAKGKAKASKRRPVV